MRQFEIMKLLTLLFIFATSNIHPIFANEQTFRINTFLAYQSKHFLDLGNSLRSTNKGISKFNIEYDTVNSASQLALNYDDDNNLTLDRSYFQYTRGIATFGIGKVYRHWSFSKNTSLILSNNARPSESIYLKLENKFGYNWLPSKANWSFEGFNAFNKDPLNGTKSMFLGLRGIFSPVEGLDFEIVQTSQWGGKGQSTGLSALSAALLFDTNHGSNSNINKMAGFGISYEIPTNIIPLRIYGQAIGEDEAGNLPSCFAYLGGLEWANTKIKYPTFVNIEAIDTRINATKNGHCGQNTMYNNSIMITQIMGKQWEQ